MVNIGRAREYEVMDRSLILGEWSQRGNRKGEQQSSTTQDESAP
jgi:hypothetical protein